MKPNLPEQDLTVKAKTVAKFESQFVKGAEHECWIWKGSINRFGSSRFNAIILNNQTREKSLTQTGHRLAWILANSAIPPHDLVVQPLCKNKLCVNPNHLELVTKSESLKSRWLSGPINTVKVLNFEQAQQIRALYHEGMGMIKLSQQFGVTYLTINRILNGTTHKITEAKLRKLKKEKA